MLNSDQPVLVDFWVPWCGPCLVLAPTIEELADRQQGRIKVGKLNVETDELDERTRAQILNLGLLVAREEEAAD